VANTITNGINGEILISGYQAGLDSYYDAYFLNLDSLGNTLWSKSYGSIYNDYGRFIHKLANGGYIISGVFADTTSGVIAGNNQMFLAKILPNDLLDWSFSYGSGYSEAAKKIIITNDEGYIMVGYTDTYGAGGTDMYVVKTDSMGTIQWSKSFGGTGSSDIAESLIQLSDSSYVIVGMTNSYGAGNSDVYVIRIAHDGSLIWSKTFGGSNGDVASSICMSHDNNLIISGSTTSFGSGLCDVYLLKISLNGDLLWSKTFGGSNNDFGNSVKKTFDGGYILSGQTNSFGLGSYDIYIIKTDSLGNSYCNESLPATLVNTGVFESSGGIRNVGGVLTNPTILTGFGAFDSTLCQIFTKVETISILNKMSVSPNPSNDNFNFEFNGYEAYSNLKLKITNIVGQELLSINVDEKSKVINLNQLGEKGIYFASLTGINGNIIEMQKIILL
jgi:hypothetical protein